MADPCWQPLPYLTNGGLGAGQFSFSNNQTFSASSGAGGMIFCPTPLSGTAGSPGTAYLWAWDVITGGNGVDQCAIGIAPIAYSGANVRPAYSSAAAAFLTENGFYFCNGSISTSVFAFTSGDRIFGYWDGKGGLAFGKVISGTRYWNGSYTDANIAAGTGLFNAETGGGSPLSGPFAVFVSMTGSATDSFAILSTSTAAPLVGGGGYLPSTGVVAISSFQATAGIDCSIGWTATGIGGISGLNCISNGTTTVLGGTTTGTMGVALGPAFSANTFQSIQIQDSTYTLDTTPPTPEIAVFAAPPGGALLYKDSVFTTSGTIHSGTVSGTLPGAPYEKIWLNVAFKWGNLGIGDATPSVTIQDASGNSVVEMDAQYGVTVGPSTLTVMNGGYSGTSPTSGPGTATGLGTTAFASLALDASNIGSGSVHASGTVTASIGGTVTNWAYSNVYIIGVEESIFDKFVVAPGATFGTTTVDFEVYLPTTEELTLTSASYATGTTTLIGADLYGTLTSANASIDGNAFAPVSSLSVSGTHVTATVNGSLSAGGHSAQLENATSGLLSNTVSFSVFATESLTLTSLTGSIGGALTFGGTGTMLPAAIDLSTNGTWAAPGSYNILSGTTFGGTGALISSPGTYVAEVRDHANTLVTSNALTLTVGATESILLTLATGSYGGTLSLGGETLYGPAPSLQVKINYAGAWHAVTGYSTGAGTITALWTGSGPVLPLYGTWPIKVRDAVSLVESNVLYLTLEPPAPPPPPPVTVQNWPGAQFSASWLANTIPSYLYVQYQDDDNLQGFVAAYNTLTQQIVNWFTSINLPIYTSASIAGPLLDWVAEGLYGIQRPLLPSGTNANEGPLNTYAANTLALNAVKIVGPSVVYATSDDVFRRIITWNFYKGDGLTFSIPWLKRRVMRFLYAPAGGDYLVDQTYPVSVTFGAPYEIDIDFVNLISPTIVGAVANTFAFNTLALNALTSTSVANGVPPLAATFKAAMDAGVLNVPFQFSVVVSV